MKLIRTYVLLAIVNWVIVSGIVVSVPAFRSGQAAAGKPVPTPAVPAAPTPTPKRRIVHVKRVIVISPTVTAAQGSISNGTAVPQTGTSMPSGVAAEPTAAPAAAPQDPPVIDTRCIITIDGARYDVTQFRSMHSGGNIFTCNADMSAVFWSQHGQSTLNRMAGYRI